MLKRFLFFNLLLLAISQNIYAQTIKDSIEINKDWWGRMAVKYPGFHGTNNRWMSTGDFNNDGLPDIVLQFAAVGNASMFWQDSLENSKRFKGVFINKGNQYFILDTNLVYYFKGGDDGQIVLDLNGDGYLDVYQPTDNWHGPRIKVPIWYKDSTNMGEYVFINNLNNSFTGAFLNDTTSKSPFNTGGATRHYQILDIDDDNNDEIIFGEGLIDELPKPFPTRYLEEDSIQVFDFGSKLYRKMLQLISVNVSDTVFRDRKFQAMFAKKDTVYGILKDPRSETAPSELDYFGYYTGTQKNVISKISIPAGLSRKPFHNTGRQGFAQDLDGDGINEYVFSFWRSSDETTYAIIFNANGLDVSNNFFDDSLNFKIGKIRAGISDVFDDINNDGFIDIIPNHGIGFKYNKKFSYFLFNSIKKKYEVKTLHNYKVKFNDELTSSDSFGIWPDYNYKSHNFILQYFNRNKDQDALFTSIKSFDIKNAFTGPDVDNDSVPDTYDNCKNMYNPNQEDLDNNNIGDACEWSPILLKKTVSILEDMAVNSTFNISDFMLDSVSKYITYGDGDYKTYFTISNNKISIKSSVNSYAKEYFKVPVIYTKNSFTIYDTITIYIIRYLNWPKNTGKLQNGYVPYYYESYSNGMTGIENTKFGPFQYFIPANLAPFIVTDIDKNGINDIIGQSVQLWYPPYSDTSKSPTNIQRIGMPVYMKLDSNFNLTYYHENFRNPDVLLHQPDFYELEDLNSDGKNEILNLGEHYHTDYFLGEQDPALPKNKFGKEVLRHLGMIENRDYDQRSARKLSRYYTIENGRLKDQKDNYDYTALDASPTDFPPSSNSKFVSIFGSAFGDIDNDGDIDYIQSVQVDGFVIDILINDGKGNYKYKRVNSEYYNYKTNPEGKNMLVDINGDGYLDYFFGGTKLTNNNQDEASLGYILNDKKGGFKIDSVNFIGNFGATVGSPKYMFIDDLDKDGKKEIIIYRTTGMGSGGNGTANLDFIDDLLILTVDNGKITNNTNSFIDTMSRSKMFSQSSYLYYIDIDGDKIKDLFIYYQVDSGINHNYPFYGYWEKNYDGFSYFKGSKTGKFKYTRLGKFLYADGFKNWYSKSENSGIFSNDFQPADLDNDGTAELIHHPFIGINLIIFKLFNCNPAKPTFNTTKFSICYGDSLKLTLSNINKGDSLKWYYGTKSDLSNVATKTFSDTTRLFVTRTDSLGCVISSDTVHIQKVAALSTPILSRDTASYLISNSVIGNTWYKDGTAITDTTQKIKPTKPGSYTVKTTQNGCISAASEPYHYLVTDVINLSADEFIKLAPNPFINQLNFDFVVKGYQRLNLEIFDIATGTKVASKQNQSPGLPIYLGQLSAGTYVIKVSSNDNKISYQFKMVKL